MAKLEIKEKIEKQENKEIERLIIGIIIILAIWIFLNIILRVHYFIKIITSIILILGVAFLVIRWYYVYYKKKT